MPADRRKVGVSAPGKAGRAAAIGCPSRVVKSRFRVPTELGKATHKSVAPHGIELEKR